MAGTNNSWNNQIAGSYNQIILNAGVNGVAISTDASAATVNVATGGAIKAATFGSVNSSSSTTIQSGSGALNITATGGALTMISGTGTMAIGSDATAQTIGFATGAGAKVATVGSTNGASSLDLKYGTANFSLASATGTIMSALNTGEITYPLQSSFQAQKSSGSTNLTGDGTVYQLICDQENFDRNSDYDNGTGAFTAPVTGIYHFDAAIFIQNLTALHTVVFCYFTTTARSFYLSTINGSSCDSNNNLLVGNSITCAMTAGDTVVVNINVQGSTKTVGVGGGATTAATYFAGYLVC